MAQDFERTLSTKYLEQLWFSYRIKSSSNSDDAIIGVRCVNTSGTSVNVTVYVEE